MANVLAVESEAERVLCLAEEALQQTTGGE
jgi:hypothetical protein